MNVVRIGSNPPPVTLAETSDESLDGDQPTVFTADVSDPYLRLLALQQRASDTSMTNQREEANEQSQRIEEARAEVRQQLDEAKREAESSSFWGEIAGVTKTVGIIAAGVATMAATGGAGAPAVLLAAGAAAKGAAAIGAKVGILDKDVAAKIDLVGSVTMAGGGALGVGAASAAASGASAVTSGSSIVPTLHSAAETVEIAAGAASGISDKIAADYNANAIDAQAGAARARNSQDTADANRETAVRQVEKTMKFMGSQDATVASIVSTHRQDENELITNIRG